MNQHLLKLKKILKKKGAGSFLITQPDNCRYISGYRADDAYLLITPDSNFIITDFRYKQEALAVKGFHLRLVENDFKKTLLGILKDLRISHVGFESSHLTYSRAVMLKGALAAQKIELEPLEGVVEGIRICKDPEEIKEIKKAIAVARKAWEKIKGIISTGISERKTAAEIDRLIKVCGADKSAFDTIVASGKNSSRPHAAVTDKTIKKGEAVMVDFGICLNSYNCDLTRMVFLGKIQGLLSDIYNICMEAQRLAIKKIRPGIAAGSIDKAARDYIASKGFGSNFGHSLGHGVGLAVHELPRISAKSTDILEPGMVFTVEPGIYIEGTGGARAEDMVLVTEKGSEILTDDIT